MKIDYEHINTFKRSIDNYINNGNNKKDIFLVLLKNFIKLKSKSNKIVDLTSFNIIIDDAKIISISLYKGGNVKIFTDKNSDGFLSANFKNKTLLLQIIKDNIDIIYKNNIKK